MFIPAVMPARQPGWACLVLLRALWPLFLAMGLGVPAQALAQTPTEGASPPSAWTHDTLGGDWGGLRSALGQQGLRFDR